MRGIPTTAETLAKMVMPTTIEEFVQLSKNLEIFTLEWLAGVDTGPREEEFFVMDDYQPRKKS